MCSGYFVQETSAFLEMNFFFPLVAISWKQIHVFIFTSRKMCDTKPALLFLHSLISLYSSLHSLCTLKKLLHTISKFPNRHYVPPERNKIYPLVREKENFYATAFLGNLETLYLDKRGIFWGKKNLAAWKRFT